MIEKYGMTDFFKGKITALAGGVGASKLLMGLMRVIPQEQLTIVVNTGDDIEMFGLHISPDIDIILYTLAGKVNPKTGWGRKADTFHCLEQLERLGEPAWFHLGDRDLATHLFRTRRLREGRKLSEITEELRQHFGLRCRMIPMTDEPVPTKIVTGEGVLHFQEYLVKHKAQLTVREIRFEGAENARPAPGVQEAVRDAAAVVLCPSNPLISIGPILAVPGVRDELKSTPAPVVAVCPLVGGASLKGPTDRMLRDLGMEVSALQIAELYRDFLDVLVIDHADAALKTEIEKLGIKVVVAATVMRSLEEKKNLATVVVSLLKERAA